jgi:hypothetical protein
MGRAALVAAHPYQAGAADSSPRRTARFAADHRQLAPFVDRFELFNRCTLFSCVAGWKTMLPCAKTEGSVIAYLRSRRPAYLVRLDERSHLRAA